MSKENKKIKRTNRKFIREAAFKIYGFKMVVAAILVLPTMMLTRLISGILGTAKEALTTASLKSAITWRTPVIVLLWALIVLIYFVFEILSQIALTVELYNGEKGSIRAALKKGISSLKNFLNPYGIFIILFVLIVSPLVGIGFSLSLTKSLYIPNFISSVVFNGVLGVAGYILLFLVAAAVTVIHSFTLHAIVADAMMPKDALALSRRLIRENTGDFFKTILKVIMIIALISIGANLIIKLLPDTALYTAGGLLPRHRITGFPDTPFSELSETDRSVIIYRLLSSIRVITGGYVMFVIDMALTGFFWFRFTALYFRYTDREKTEFIPVDTKKKKISRVLFFAAAFVFMLALSVLIGVFFEKALLDGKKVNIIAHRTGGYLASENSLEGIDESVSRGLYGCETDIQRTKDGEYIINHDTTFKRLTGVNKKPSELTLSEIKELKIKDTTGSGKELPVPTLDELLERGKGRIKLFLELKGESADNRMADDVVAAVRAKDMTDEVVIISLKYDVIDYIEKNYPEFETGVLIFGGMGDVSRLNCDMIIMEEEMSTDTRLYEIHSKGKKTGVWTVNTEMGLNRFLKVDTDAVITDDIEQALSVREALDERTDFDIIRDFASGMFE